MATSSPLDPSLVREGGYGLEGAKPLPKYFPLSFEERGLRGEVVRHSIFADKE